MSDATTTDARLTKFTISHTPGVEQLVGKEERLTLADVAALAKRTQAGSKDALPMIIAGTFGPSRARTNENMTGVTVVMGDYDAGLMTPEAGAEKLIAAGIEGAIITSPRHMVETNKGVGSRWRVICPLSNPVSLREHKALAEKLNGVFGQDVLGVEGKSASRPYYYGSLTGQPECETRVIPGTPLDLATDIPELKFPKSKHETIMFPEIEAGVDVAEAVLEGACDSFTGGHEGLKPACLLVAPFIRVLALDGEEAARCLQERLEATSSRNGNDVPDDEAARTLKWMLTSDLVNERVRHLELAVLLDEMTPAAAARTLYEVGKLWNDDPKLASKVADFMLCPCPPETEEELAARKAFLEAKQADVLPEEPAPDIHSGNHWFGDKPYGDRRWLVHGVLPETGVALLSGQWGAGKTFAGIELSVCAMFALPFAGYEVDRPCGVLWLAAEGEAELSERLQAALALRPDLDGTRAPFVWRDTFPRLLDHGAAAGIIAMAKATAAGMAERGVKLGLVILDTLGAGAGWDNENDSAQGQRAMNALREIGKATGALVIAIDHFGKDTATGTRGTSAKEAAADTVLAILAERDDNGDVKNRRMAVRKSRGGRSGAEHPLTLNRVIIGTDDKGREETTCVVGWIDRTWMRPDVAPDAGKQPEPKAKAWHGALQSGKAATLDDWFAEGVRTGLAEAIGPDDTRTDKIRKRQTFHNAKHSLVALGWVEVDNDTVRDLRPNPTLADLTAG